MQSPTISYRMLGIKDVDSIVELDRSSGGVSRRGFISKRLHGQQCHPDAFISMAAISDDALVGFVFCHIIKGEFGGSERVAVLDAIGVSPDQQGHGIGHAMLEELTVEVRARGGRELRTQARWNQRGLVDFFSSIGFSLAPRLVLECETDTRIDFPRAADNTDEQQWAV